MEFLQHLRAEAGYFSGRGINHEREGFTGSLAIRTIASGAVIWFRATGDAGQVFHEEIVLLGADFAGSLTMSSLNSNIPAMQHFTSEAVQTREARFVMGDVAGDTGFRERVILRLEADGGVTYRFDWGMPGEAVAERSAVTMARAAARPAGCPFTF